MKHTFISTLLVAFCTSVFAQQNIVSALSTPNAGGAKVTVIDPDNTPVAQPRSSATIKAYRVRIYFDNSQDARSGSGAAATKFKELYPETPTFTEYKSPYFKVTAGNFLTREEAIILWGKIINIFPNAFVVSETLPLSDFTNSVTLGIPTSPTTTENGAAAIPDEQAKVEVEETEEE